MSPPMFARQMAARAADALVDPPGIFDQMKY
jgi:hypothetical protein